MFEVKALGLFFRGYRCYRYPHLCGHGMYLVVVAQLVLAFFLALFFVFFSVDAAVSAFVGGLCCGVPNSFFVWRVFRYRGVSAARSVVRSFYLGGVGKFFLTVVAFILVFTLVKTVEVVPLFVAFIVVQLGGLFVSVLVG